MTTVAEAFVTLRPDLGKFADETKKGLTGALGGIRDVAATAVKAFAVVGTAAAAASLVAVRAAMEEEQSLVQLAQAAKQAGVNWEEQGEKVNATVTAWSRLAAVSDDEIRPAFSLMIAQTGSLEEAMTRMPHALDLARGGNIDLATAARLLGKVSDETTTVLARMGIVIKDGAKEADVFAAIQQKFGGQAKAFADSAAGSWANVRNEFDDIVEMLGMAMLPLFKEVTGAVLGFLRAFSDNGGLKAAQDAIKTTISIVKEMFAVLSGSDPFAGGALTALVGPDVAATIMAVLATIRDTFQTTFALIGSVIEGFRTGNWDPLAEAIRGGAEDMVTRFEHLGSTLGNLFGAIGTLIVENAPTILAAIGEWAKAFVDWVGPLLPVMMAALAQLIQNVLVWIASNANTIVTTLAAWAKAFLEWIAPLIPPFLVALGSVINSLLEWVAAQIPGIVKQLEEWATAFIAWVVPQIPVLIGEGVKLLRALLDWVGENADDIGTQLGDWAIEFVAWIAGTAVPALIEHLPEIIRTLLGFIITVVPTLTRALLDMGVHFIGTFIEGIWSAKDDLWNALVEVGKAAVQGLASGLASMWGWITGRIRGLVMLIPEVIRDLLGIHSPSEEMADIGEEIPTGLVEGMKANLPALDEFLPDLVAWVEKIGPAIAPAVRAVGVGIVDALIEGLNNNVGRLAEAVREAVGKGMEEAESATKAFRALAGSTLTGSGLVDVYAPEPFGESIGMQEGRVQESDLWVRGPGGIPIKMSDWAYTNRINVSVEIDGREIARAEAVQSAEEARRFGFTTGAGVNA